MKTNRREAEGVLGESPFALEPAVADDSSGLARKQRPVRIATDERGQVRVDGIQYEAREHDRALARLGLRYLPTSSLVDRLADGQGGLEAVVVTPMRQAPVVPKANLEEWLRAQYAEFVLRPEGVYIAERNHDWPLIARDSSELTARLEDGGRPVHC